MKYSSKENKKVCFCIGPDKCKDKDCELVKEYNKKRKIVGMQIRS